MHRHIWINSNVCICISGKNGFILMVNFLRFNSAANKVTDVILQANRKINVFETKKNTSRFTASSCSQKFLYMRAEDEIRVIYLRSFPSKKFSAHQKMSIKNFYISREKMDNCQYSCHAPNMTKSNTILNFSLIF